MKKRIIIFGVCLDRELSICEYGDSVVYEELCESVVGSDENGNMDNKRLEECVENGGSYYVRGVSGLLGYYYNGDVWEGGDVDKFLKNVIKYKDLDIDWNESKEEDFMYEFWDSKEDYEEYVKMIKEDV